MKILKITQLLTLIAFLTLSCSNDDDNKLADSNQLQLTVLAQGSSVVQPKTFTHPQTNEIIEAGCFLMEVIDPVTNEIIGTLEDCVVSEVDNGDGTVTSRVITTINLNGRGAIMVENQVLQTPTGTEGILATSFTPIENNIIGGSHEFDEITGLVYLSGEIDVTLFRIGIVTFNCKFGVDADL